MDEAWVNEASPWIRYPLDRWKCLTDGRTPVLYKKRSVLYEQDDPAPYAFIVASGRVRIACYSSNGIEKQLCIAESGCLLAEISCIMGFHHPDLAICIQDSYIYRIPQADLIDAIRNNWEMNMQIYNSVFRKNVIYRNQILELSFASAVSRIARVLLNLCDHYGALIEDGYYLNVHFTHSDIASMVNVSRVTVNTTITWLMQNDYLRKEGQNYVILSKDRLEELADSGEQP